MQKIILVGRNGRPSATALFNELKTKGITLVDRIILKSGPHFRITEGTKKPRIVPVAKLALVGATVVRWGNRIEVAMKNCIVYNKSEAIAKASNKKLTRELLCGAKVDCPKLITPQNVAAEDFPIIARPLYHWGGKHVVILKTKEEFTKHWNTNNKTAGWYYSNVIKKNREIRIHVGHGKVLAVVEKTPPADPAQVIWNLSQVGEPWTVIPWDKYTAAWCRKAVGAVEAVGLDFGAVDLVIKGSTAYVLEVNTSAGMGDGEYMKKRYALYLEWLFRSQKERQHNDYKKFESGKSYAWKNFQLLEEPEPVN